MIIIVIKHLRLPLFLLRAFSCFLNNNYFAKRFSRFVTSFYFFCSCCCFLYNLHQIILLVKIYVFQRYLWEFFKFFKPTRNNDHIPHKACNLKLDGIKWFHPGLISIQTLRKHKGHNKLAVGQVCNIRKVQVQIDQVFH